MEINRKRVARRIVSGLVAGAVALGGLAISGGTVSANTPSSPTTNRISGADRYETAVAIARNQLGSSNPTALVIASGESTADALAGASLINSTDTMVMLLVRKDSIPSSVSDFIADYKSAFATGSKKVYVLGGESAISSDVFDALKSAITTAGSLTPPSVKRLAGDTRYGTAKAIADVTGVTDASDTLIIVNGEDGKWADALSAGQLAAENEWPIALATSAGLSDAAKAQITALYAAPGSLGGKYLIIGGPAVVPTSVESYMIALGIPPTSIQRIAGADRYQTNFLVQTYSLGTGGAMAAVGLGNQLADFQGKTVALVSGESPYDALVSASWASKNSAHVVLTPAAGGNVNTLTLAGTLASLRDNAALTNATLYVLGGKSAVADSAKTAYAAASNTNLTSTLTCPTVGASTGGDTATLILSGRAGLGHVAAITSTSAMATLVKKNNAAVNTFGTNGIIDLNAADHGTATRQAFAIQLNAVPTAGDTITFAGLLEGTAAGSVTPTQSIGSSSCTVALDAAAPVVTMRVKAGAGADETSRTTSAGTYLHISSNEKVSVSSAAGLILIAGTATTTSATVTNIATGTAAAGTDFLVRINDAVSTTALSSVVEFDLDGIKDIAGNKLATTISATAATDATAPTITVGSVSSTASAQAKYQVGSLSVEAAALGKWDGAAGSSFTIKVTNQRGVEIPTIAIDETAKTIVVTADTGYHTVNDVARAALNAGLTAPLLGNWKVTNKSPGALTDKVTANVTPATCGTTCGQSRVTVSIGSNEAFTLATAGTAVTVDGLGTPFVSTIVTGGTQAYSSSTDTTSLELLNYREVTFYTTRAGSATMSFTGDTNGVNDLSGNNVVLPVSFTVS